VGSAPLAVVGFLVTEIFEAMGPGHGQADDFGHAAVVAKKCLGRVAVM
jgi:hypothetical protein